MLSLYVRRPRLPQKMTETSLSWSSLPEHVIINILSNLNPGDRGKAGSTCRSWNSCSKSPELWKTFTFTFLDTANNRSLECLTRHGQHLKSVRIVLDQHESQNRINACKVLNGLADIPNRKLTSLKVIFIGENPLFYAGQDFVEALKNVFRKPTESEKACSLRHVDLSGLYVMYDSSVFDVLSENNPEMESLNIINETQICKVHPDCIVRLVERCKNLTDLRLFHCSLFDKALSTFTQAGHTPPNLLSILCRKEESLSKGIASETWADLAKHCPKLRVILTFDHTCPLNKVAVIMKPEIPVVELHLETHTDIYDEVNQAASYYNTTLETVVLQTRRSPELITSLIHLCSSCTKLTTLLVYCVLDKEVVEKILDLCPVMKQRGTYILKWTLDPEPWLMKVQEVDELGQIT